MNSNAGIWYNELYRLFASSKLLSVDQTIKLGQCLRAIQAGENAEYHLNELYYSLRNNKKLADQLEEFMHSYIKSFEEKNEDKEYEENPVLPSTVNFYGSWT